MQMTASVVLAPANEMNFGAVVLTPGNWLFNRLRLLGATIHLQSFDHFLQSCNFRLMFLPELIYGFVVFSHSCQVASGSEIRVVWLLARLDYVPAAPDAIPFGPHIGLTRTGRAKWASTLHTLH